jgi:hypothetical protein
LKQLSGHGIKVKLITIYYFWVQHKIFNILSILRNTIQADLDCENQII